MPLGLARANRLLLFSALVTKDQQHPQRRTVEIVHTRKVDDDLLDILGLRSRINDLVEHPVSTEFESSSQMDDSFFPITFIVACILFPP